jgi:hypothetical protein
VEVGRKEGDGLPPKATGAALLCYASGVDEAGSRARDSGDPEGSRSVAAGGAELGTLDERLKAGDEIDEAEQALMQRALEENSVIVAEMTPFFD